MFTYDLGIEDARWEVIFPDLPLILDLVMTTINTTAQLGLSENHFHIEIILTNDKAIKELNRSWRNKDYPANVLSFPLHPPLINMVDSERKKLLQQQPLWLGSVVVSLDSLEREVQTENKNLKDHFCHLVIHSVLHLLGYDHKDNREAEEMEKLEAITLQKLGICNPYD